MDSIQKIVLTPLKWASKQIINHTLLRFPGGDAHSPIACTYCPEMCRFSCPTAVVSGNDAVTPSNKMSLLYKEKKWPGQASQGAPLWPIYDCTGCGRCTEYCVYEVPVAEKLFQARKQYPWNIAQEAAQKLTDESDAVGDLADELGDEVSSLRRLKNFVGEGRGKTSQSLLHQVTEPKALAFLQKNGYSGKLSWEDKLREPPSFEVQQKLSGRTWLFHESVWFNRHLGRTEELKKWIDQASACGIQLKRPFAQGNDCIDCGGEGSYFMLFPTQAAQMAKEQWERDCSQVDGILCVSQRCVEHFRRSLGTQVPICSLAEILRRRF